MRPAALLVALTAFAAPAHAQDESDGEAPLSSIDWLSRSVAEPAALPEPPVTDSAATPEIIVRPLDSKSPDAVGLIAPEVSGLPRSLWSGSSEEVLTTLLAAERTDPLPAMQELTRTLVLARADPPFDAGPQGALYLARVDRLLDMGALDPAQALLEEAGPETPERFRRWFDVSLLTGTENAACALMKDRPAIAPTLAARIFCLARGGDWQAAALTLNSARALGDVSDAEDAMLSRFLDPDLYEDDELPIPERTSPLIYRLREAVGDQIPTSSLPRAFAHADLRQTKAWRAQLEAAERLARNGAIQPSQLFDIYTAHVPAASGGIWDRAAAVQAFDAAIRSGDGEAVSKALPAAWDAMQVARTEVPFAQQYAESLAELDLDPAVMPIAIRVGFLGLDYEAVALNHAADSKREKLLSGLARGNVDGLSSSEPMEQALIDGFTAQEIPDPFPELIEDGRLGEALLRAIAMFDQGVGGDTGALSDALAVFREVGLEDVARRAALQLLIMERPA